MRWHVEQTMTNGALIIASDIRGTNATNSGEDLTWMSRLPMSLFTFASQPKCLKVLSVPLQPVRPVVGPRQFQYTAINHAAFSLLPSLSDQSGDGGGSRGSCTPGRSPGFLDSRGELKQRQGHCGRCGQYGEVSYYAPVEPEL